MPVLSQVLPSPTNIGAQNNTLTVFNGKLYCLFYGGQNAVQPNLWEWDGVSPSWVSVANTLSIGGHVLAGVCLTVFNNHLYAGSLCDDISNAHSGSLLEWDGISAWAVVADGLGGEYEIDSLCVFNGSLYGGTRQHGMLYQWNGVNAWTQVAGQLSGQTDILSLLVFNGALYGSTSKATPPGVTGLLLRWNGVNAWVEVAAQFGPQESVWDIFEFNNHLYGVTDTSSLLLEWDGVSSWGQIASPNPPGPSLHSAVVYDNNIYAAGAYNHGAILESDGTNPWTVAAAGTFQPISSMVVYNNNLYAMGGGILYQVGIILPTVTTNAATNIGINSAQLNGNLTNDGGEACACGFQWGPTMAYGNTTPTTAQVTGDNFDQVISGLTQGTTYHSRSFATNSAGTGYGNDLTFTTLAPIRVHMTYPVKRRKI